MSQSVGARGRLRWPALQWRREGLTLAYAIMEVCWITPLFLIFTATGWRFAPYAAATVLGSLLLAFFYLARLAERWSWEPAKARGLMLLTLPLAILLCWRIFLHGDVALLDLSWIQAAGSDMIAGQGGGHWVVMAMVLFVWWRGLALSRREFAFASVALAFRSGLLLLALGTVLLSVLTGRQVNGLIYVFFFASLVAVALTRLEEVGLVRGAAGRRIDLFWLAMLITIVGLILSVGALFSVAASPQGIAAIRQLWAPIGSALISALLWLISLLLRPFEPFLQWLADMLAGFWRHILDPELVQALAGLDSITGQVPDPRAELVLYAAATATRLICGAVLLMVLLAAGLWALNRQRKRQEEVAEEHAGLDTGLLGTLIGLVIDGRQRLRRAVDMISRFGLGSDLLAAVSVRAIYANTARLARQRGHPRHRAVTPYEYLPDLLVAFPHAQEEARAITDAYVAVHYGELPATRDELAQMRAAYERLKESPPPASAS